MGAAFHVGELDLVASVYQALRKVEFQIQSSKAGLDFKRFPRAAVEHVPPLRGQN